MMNSSPQFGVYINATRRASYEYMLNEREKCGWLTMTPIDRNLLDRIGAGDQIALRQLYHAYRQKLWRYLWLQLDGDAGLVEEVMQDVFVSVWRTASAFRGEAQVSTWIYRIAHNTAANTRRARSRRIEGQLPERLDLIVQSVDHSAGFATPSSEEAVVARMTLEGALAALSPKHREALELLFVHGFTYDEIAAITGVPTGTVKSRISYARRALRSLLSPEPLPQEIYHDTL